MQDATSSGRVTVFVLDVEDPMFTATVEQVSTAEVSLPEAKRREYTYGHLG